MVSWAYSRRGRRGLRLILLSLGAAWTMAFVLPVRPSRGGQGVVVSRPGRQEGVSQLQKWVRGASPADKMRLYMVKRELADISTKDFYEALQTFIETYEKREMPEDFVVPFDAKRWPDRLHGVKLGRHFQKLITEGEVKEQDPDMASRIQKDLGIRIGLSDWEKCLKALRAYRDNKGSMKVPGKWVVPDEEPWPQEVRGYRLGLRVTAIRQTGKFVNQPDPAEKDARMRELDDLGFEWKLRGEKDKGVKMEELDSWYAQVVEGLQAYKRIMGDLESIKSTYTIPNSPEWPENVRGMPLGQKLTYIKSRSNILTEYPERRDELLRMGVNLATRESQIEERFQAILVALQTYKKVNGHVNVPQSFVVPDNDKWPEEIRGMRLGIRVNAIRSQQTFIRNNPERRKILEDLGLDTKPVKSSKRKKLDDDYKYVDEDEDNSDSAWREEEDGEGGAERDGAEEEGSGANGSDDPTRPMTKDEILAMQEKAGLDWYFVGRQPGQTWFQQVEDLGLGNYPFLPLLTPEQHHKTKHKAETAMRGCRINPTFQIQPPALKQYASEIECFPTGALLDNIVEAAAMSMDPDSDQVMVLDKLREDTRVSKLDYRRKLVPDTDIDKETPQALDQDVYWAALYETTDGEMGEFGEDGSFQDVIHALEVFKERYGHVRVPLSFEFRVPEDEDDDDDGTGDWFKSIMRRDAGDDWDQDAEPEFVNTAVSLSTMYDAKAALARRRDKAERRPKLTGLFEEEEDEEGLGLASLGGLFDDEDDTITDKASDEPDPEDDDDVLWPEEVLGLPLGDVCWMLRSGVIAAKEVPERRAALDALGFDWSPDDMYVDLRWDVFLGTYYHWRVIKGVPLVPWDFIVPEEAPWPFFCRGVELGKMCNLIRQKHDVFQKYYPERCQTLEIFGWKWWWPTLDDEEMALATAEGKPYNRYNNMAGLDGLLDLKFIDPEETDLVTQPDFEAIKAQEPESIPWREQQHHDSWDGNTDLPDAKPARTRRTAVKPAAQESAAAPTKGRRAASASSSKSEKRGPSARRRHFPMEGEEAHEADYDQEILDFINSWE